MKSRANSFFNIANGRRNWRKIRHNPFFGNFFSYLSGNVLAQAITLISYPIISRIYDAGEFGEFSIFFAAMGIILVGASARYELAIVLPTRRHHSVLLFWVSLFFSLASCLAIYILIFFLGPSGLSSAGVNISFTLCLLLPVVIFFASFIKSFTFLLTRFQLFSSIVGIKVLQAFSLSALQIGIGLISSTSLVLAGSLLFSHLFVTIFVLKRYARFFLLKLSKRDYRRSKSLVREYSSYPVYDIAPSILETLAAYLPLFIISAAFSLQLAGYFAMSTRILALPASLIGVALSQILLQKVTALFREEFGSVIKIVGIVTAVAAAFAFLPVIMLIFYGEFIFSFVLGEEWRKSGWIASILIVPIALQFIVSPLSVVLAPQHNLRIASGWKFLYFFSLLVTLSYASRYDFELFLYIYAVHELILYGLYYVLIIIGAKRPMPKVKVSKN